MPARIRSLRQSLPGRGAAIEGADGNTKAELEPLTVRIPTAVKMTGIGRSKLYELIAAGEIDIVKIGAITLIPIASLRGLIDRATRPSGGR